MKKKTPTTLRVLIFSDLHYSENSLPEEKRWWPEIYSFFNIFSKKIALKFLNFCDLYTQQSFKIFTEQISHRKYEMAICLGDMTPGVLESGLISNKAQAEAKILMEKLTWLFKKIPSYFILGNHDVGYRALIGYKKGGMSQTSLRIASSIYNNPLFFSFPRGKIRFIILNSSLITNKKNFKELYLRQLDFLQKEFLFGDNNFLLFHNPFALRDDGFCKIVKTNLAKVEAILCGNIHSRFVGEIIKSLIPFSEKLYIIPSTIGFLGFGRGFAELTLNESNFKLKYFKMGL